MKAKNLFIIFICFLFFAACDGKKSYVIEGNLEGLNNPTLYFITSINGKTKVDTILSKDGNFQFISSYDSVSPVIIYMEEGDIWATVWAKNEELIQIFGDVNYPELIEANGNEINDLLTEFRQNNKDIIKEKSDLSDKLKAKSDEIKNSSNDEDIARKVEINQLLVEKAENFIKEHPSSVASLVLTQDYLMENEDWEVLNEYLSLIESPAKEDVLFSKLSLISNKLQQTSVGANAPDFSLIDTKGDTLTLDSFKDKHLLLAFANSSCEACHEDYPLLEKIRKEYSKKKLDILFVIFDEEQYEWNKVKEEYKINGFQVIDRQGLASSFLSLYNVNTIPNYFLIDTDKKIVIAHAQITDIEKALKEYVK